jgi:hypothetical protein
MVRGNDTVQDYELLPWPIVLLPSGSYSPWGHVGGAWLEGGSLPGTGEVLLLLKVVRQTNHTLRRAPTAAALHWTRGLLLQNHSHLKHKGEKQEVPGRTNPPTFLTLPNNLVTNLNDLVQSYYRGTQTDRHKVKLNDMLASRRGS